MKTHSRAIPVEWPHDGPPIRVEILTASKDYVRRIQAAAVQWAASLPYADAEVGRIEAMCAGADRILGRLSLRCPPEPGLIQTTIEDEQTPKAT